MMETVDSKKQQLTLQEVIIRAVYNYKDKLDMPVEQALLLIMEELRMKNSEAIQFGNTVFVTHYTPDKGAAVMRTLNVDTIQNVLKNGELYIRHILQYGVEELVTTYTQKSFEAFFREIEKRKIGTYKVKQFKDDYFAAVIKMPIAKKYKGKRI
jgi:hypothetical protein